MKRTLITRITRQDCSYLAEHLLGQSYGVHGLIRRASAFNTDGIDHLHQDPHEAGARLFLRRAPRTTSAPCTSCPVWPVE